MPANVETMAYYGQVPWHRHGTRLNSPATAAQAMAAAGLDWEVQKQPLYTGVNRDIRVNSRYVVCRTDRLGEPDGGQLGVVGQHFEPLQNREAFSFLDPVVGMDAAVYHTAGSLRCGRQTWLLAKLPDAIRIAGEDIVDKYLLLANGHDGSMAVRVLFTPIRVVCQNTLNLALRQGSGLSVRHYPDVARRVQEAARLMALANETFQQAGIIMQRTAQVPMIGDRLDGYFHAVIPLPVDEDGRVLAQAKHARFHELFEAGIGNDMPGVRGTLWAAYNAVTQWVDRESYTPRNKEPLRSIWFGDGAKVKARAYEAARQMATA